MSAFSDTNEANWREQDKMWPIKRKSAEELDSVLYFLSSALSSVIDESSYLVQHHAALPQIGAGLATAEIASRLAVFRQQVCDVSEREYVIVTRLARARHWAHELRRHEPHLRADIDAFLAATVRCEAMARERRSDAQSLFDGHAQPKRFLADRVPGGRVAADAALSLMERLQSLERGEIADDESPSYLIGGEISVEALNDVCETLLARLAAHYGWADEAQGLPAEEAAAALDEPEIGEADANEDAAADQVDAGTGEPKQKAAGASGPITEAPEKTEEAPETQGEETQESEEVEKPAAETASAKDAEANSGGEKEPAPDQAAKSGASSEPSKPAAAIEQTAEPEEPPRAASG
jgi:hypothetical protein